MAKENNIPVVPTLHAISTPSLSRPEDVATYLIQFLFVNPGATSSVNEDDMLSYRKLYSLYGNDPDRLGIEIAERLTRALGRYFPDKGYLALCTIENKEKVSEEGIWQGNKVIVINIGTTDSIPLIPSANITVNEQGDKFEIHLPTARGR